MIWAASDLASSSAPRHGVQLPLSFWVASWPRPPGVAGGRFYFPSSLRCLRARAAAGRSMVARLVPRGADPFSSQSAPRPARGDDVVPLLVVPPVLPPPPPPRSLLVGARRKRVCVRGSSSGAPPRRPRVSEGCSQAAAWPTLHAKAVEHLRATPCLQWPWWRHSGRNNDCLQYSTFTSWLPLV
ncbi:unnamed protein product [Prorocentrum cordatum]|uniref:Uncharacterized protein n=1 Tax=Prorocentrum cordatum TaxID=2364126 RepID=A0ABN9UV29_9DINO|nr:unnamed protein product [Polarella glacialis]